MFLTAFKDSMIVRYQGDLPTLRGFSLFSPKLKKYAKKDQLDLLKHMMANNWNLTKHDAASIRLGLREYQNCTLKLNVSIQSEKPIIEPIEAYLRRVKSCSQSITVTPFVDFALSLIAFIPTTVGCESTFSRHNNNLREDRKSMDRETSNGYIKTSTRKLDLPHFDYDQVAHLLPYMTCSGDATKQNMQIDLARKASMRAYRNNALGV